MSDDEATQAAAARWWCRRCGKQVTISGSEPEISKAVHAATGLELGADGHLVAPIDHEPPLWKAAREIQADYAGTFEVDAKFGFLRADWVVSGGGTPVHFEARTEQEMRARLAEAVAVSRRERSREGSAR